MRAVVSIALVSMGLALQLYSQSGRAQPDRDFVFTDEDGHLVIRFTGTGATGLGPSQTYEISNQEFSTMIHDRLHADLQFVEEQRDPEWAVKMEPQIAQHVEEAGHKFSDIIIECRVASCRIIMEQIQHWTVPEHQAVLETVQQSLEAFIADRRQYFEPGFMITAYDQEFEISHIKAFLRRIGYAPPEQASGG